MSDKIHYCFRIVEVQNGLIKTLFHGINGSRIIPRGKWIKAEKKLVDDGGTKYISGFHVLKSRATCQKYLKTFKLTKTKRIVPVLAKGLRPKSHSRHPVFLASEMYLQ